MRLIYRYRDWVSLPPAALVLLLLLGATAQTVVRKLASSHPEVKVELNEAAPPPEKALEPPRAAAPTPAPAQAQPRAVAAAPQAPSHASEAGTEAPSPAAPTPSTPAPAAPAAHPAPAAPAAPAANPAPRAAEHESVQNAFTARIRADVLARKSYPRSREASLEKPRGIVRAWLELDRSGAIREVGIETGSGSMILDSAARKLLRGGSYPAFPEAAFPGEGSHRFYFDLDYQPGAAS